MGIIHLQNASTLVSLRSPRWLTWAEGTSHWFKPTQRILCRGLNLNFTVLKKAPMSFNPLPDHTFCDSSKMKDFADDNFKFDENGRKLSKPVENTEGKGEIARYVKWCERVLVIVCNNGPSPIFLFISFKHCPPLFWYKAEANVLRVYKPLKNNSAKIHAITLIS